MLHYIILYSQGRFHEGAHTQYPSEYPTAEFRRLLSRQVGVLLKQQPRVCAKIGFVR